MNTVNLQIIVDGGDVVILVDGRVYTKFYFDKYESKFELVEVIKSLLGVEDD